MTDEMQCRVYWGSHGCSKPRGHDGPHVCDVDCIGPENNEYVFGEDYEAMPYSSNAIQP